MRTDKGLVLGAILVVSVIGTFYALLRTSLFDGSVPIVADSIADWLVTRALFDGLDPYQPLATLADHYHVEYLSPLDPLTPIHPRLPGALILQAPMLLADPITTSHWLTGFSVAALTASGLVVGRVGRASPLLAPTFPVMAFMSGVAFWAFVWVTQSPIMTTLLILGVLSLTKWRQPIVGGVLLGILGALKPFTLIFLLPLIVRRHWRPVFSATWAFALLNAFPMVWFGISIGDVLSALRQAMNTWFHNGSNISLASWLDRWIGIDLKWVVPLHVVILVLWLIVMLARRRPATAELLGWGMMGVFLSPMSWPHYLIVVIPLVWLLLSDRSIPHLSKAFVALGLVPFFAIGLGFWYPLGITLILVGVALTPKEDMKQPDLMFSYSWSEPIQQKQ